MGKQSINTIKQWFKTGLKPAQQQFWDWLDSFRHKDDKIPVADIEGIDELLQSKADKAVLDNHLTDSNAHSNEFDKKLDVTAMQEHLNDGNAHATLFDEKVDKVPGKQLSTEDYTTQDKNTLESLNMSFGGKEDKSQKGVSGGYVPLDEFIKISGQYLSIVDDLVSGGSEALLSAEQGKVLKTQIDAINTLLTSDNVNLDTVQEIVDAIETVQTSLSTILVNDLTTGGTTKALTAEMGKSLKELIDSLGAPISGVENCLPKFSADGLVESNISEENNKVGINNPAAEAALDIKNSPSVETILSGTFSFDGMMITGVGTLMLSELQREDVIKVVSTGNTYTINDIMGETMAFSWMGGEAFDNQVCSVVKINKKILNINDFFEVGYNEYGEPQILFKARILNQHGTVESQTDNINNFQNNYGPDGGQMGTSFSFPQGYPKFSFNVSKEYNGYYWFKVSDSSGNRYIAFSEYGEIKIMGLPTSPAGSGIVYKDSNGFLKIG